MTQSWLATSKVGGTRVMLFSARWALSPGWSVSAAWAIAVLGHLHLGCLIAGLDLLVVFWGRHLCLKVIFTAHLVLSASRVQLLSLVGISGLFPLVFCPPRVTHQLIVLSFWGAAIALVW